ncbi:aspartate-semialdehyde dehydrogenase [bacterium]|nr:aspartate-semialdehyde dehydrogenase [bacterium]MBU1025757.1 aspartate-semialdehyde dehydrogenase [bacterium]
MKTKTMNINNPTIVILGASGLVGGTLISILKQREFPCGELRLCSSPGGTSKELTINGENYTATPFDESVFDGADIVFFSGPDDMSPQYAPKAISAGAVVIDNSAHFRLKPGVPLIIPEVNGHCIGKHSGLIANPNCSTSGLVVALAPVNRALGLEWVAASTYQAISGAGAKPKNDFIESTKAAVDSDFMKLDPGNLAFNLIPAVGSFSGVQNFSEEERLINETRKILEHPVLKVYPTCVRVPVLNVHSISVTFQTEKPFSDGEIESLLADADGVEIIDDLVNRKFPTPVGADGKDEVQVGRIRRFEENRGGMWVVADNLRKGAALNSVQIAELLLKYERAKNG